MIRFSIKTQREVRKSEQKATLHRGEESKIIHQHSRTSSIVCSSVAALQS
jgi:hypothetical protein